MELDIDRDLTGYSGNWRDDCLGKLRFGTALGSYPQRRSSLVGVSGTTGLNCRKRQTVWNYKYFDRNGCYMSLRGLLPARVSLITISFRIIIYFWNRHATNAMCMNGMIDFSDKSFQS